MGKRVSEYVEIGRGSRGEEVYKCTRCGGELGLATNNFKEHVVMKEKAYADYVAAGVLVNPSDRFVIREFYCPHCAVCLDTESVLKGEPYLEIKIDEKP